MATIPVFRTWVAGEVVTAAYFNSNVRDAGNFFLSWPVFEGRQTVAQSLTSGLGAAITLDTEDVDTDGAHSLVSNTSRYTPITQGRFQISAGVGYASNATGLRWAEWNKNGAQLNGGSVIIPACNGQSTRVPARTMTLFFNGSTDYCEIIAVQTSGGALNTGVVAGDQSTMSTRMVGTT